MLQYNAGSQKSCYITWNGNAGFKSRIETIAQQKNVKWIQN